LAGGVSSQKNLLRGLRPPQNKCPEAAASLRARFCGRRPSTRVVLLSRPGLSYQAGGFDSIEMARKDKQSQLLASVHVPGHFKANALVVSFPRFLGKRLRSNRINRP